MMQTKLTLRLDDHLIARAKAWARARDTSLSGVVAGFFARLPDPQQEPDAAHLSPWTRHLVGAACVPGKPAPAEDQLQRDYVDYLEEKYR